MSHLFGLGCCFLLIAVITTEAQNRPSINVSSKCLGNVLRVDVGPLGGNFLEVAVVMDNFSIPLTQHLASQCGFSMRMDRQGNALISASIQNCFARNVKDETFTTMLRLWLHGNSMVKDEVHQVVETCRYTPWSSREIICDHNYMEVSVRRAAPDQNVLLDHSIPEPNSRPQHTAESQLLDPDFTMTAVVLYTPAEKVLKVREANRRGYWIQTTPTRLVVRGPRNPSDAYTQNVAGLPMTVFKTATIFEKKGVVAQIDAAAACPTSEGSVSFSSNTITWYLPRHIDPLISSSQFQLLEVHVGVNGQRISSAEMEARRFSMSVKDPYILLEIPVGAAGGFFKSHVQDNQYLISYTIEPMLELLWTEDAAHKDTRYKVLLPITTPPVPQPLHVSDNTVPQEQVFKVALGHFAPDVALTQISFSSEVLSVTELNAKGFNLLEHQSPNSSFKFFTLEVPFTASVVHQRNEMGNTVYSLHLTFGLLVLEELIPFSHTAYLEASSESNASKAPTVPPSVSGGCDNQNFYILVTYGTPHYPFLTTVGKQILTRSLAALYHLQDNGTHFSFVVPFSAPDAVFEAVESSSIRSRLDVTLTNPETNTNIQEFSTACSFFSTLTECFSNGTMTALAVKLESVPSLNPSQLTLRDPACGPAYSDGRYAYFVFTANSCGTTRKFLSNRMMMYENEISLPDELEQRRALNSEEPEYELKISCFYDINKSQAVAFHTRARRSEPYAENSKGQLQVVMRVSLDDSYSVFHRADGHPITKYLQQPLYFEVQLMKATNPKVSLELENCWATLDEDKTSQPRWNLIVNGCPNPVDTYQVVFHPVWSDARVQYPTHFKRFEVQMFAFADDTDDLSQQLFVHCDVVICDARNPLGGVCSGQCSNPETGMKGQRRAVSDVHSFTHVSLGPILMS